MKRKTSEMMLKIWNWFLIIFGLFLAYQILRKILEGSWQTEALIISMLFLNIVLTFALAKSSASIKAEIRYINLRLTKLEDNSENLNQKLIKLENSLDKTNLRLDKLETNLLKLNHSFEKYMQKHA